MKYITIADIAKKINKSQSTVTRVLRNKKDGFTISKKTRELVLKTAREMHYSPNLIAKSLSQKGSRVIGLILPNLVSLYNSSICQCLDEEFNKRQYECILSLRGLNPWEKEQKIIQNLLSRRVEGIIIIPGRMGPEESKMMKNFMEQGSRVPLFRFHDKRRKSILSKLKEAALEISRLLNN